MLMSHLCRIQTNLKNKSKNNKTIGIILYSNLAIKYVYTLYQESLIRGFYFDFIDNKKQIVVLFRHNINFSSYIKKKQSGSCYIKYLTLKTYSNVFSCMHLHTNCGLLTNTNALELKKGGKFCL